MPLPPRRVEYDPGLQFFGRPQLPTTRGEAVMATIQDPTMRPTQEALMLNERSAIGMPESPLARRGRQAGMGAEFKEQPELTPAQKELVSPEVAKKEYPHLDLHYDAPVPRAVLEYDAQNKKAEKRRYEIINAAPGGVATSALLLGTGFLASSVDPLGIGLSVIPGFGAATRSAMAARMARAYSGAKYFKTGVGRAAAVEGAAVGVVGNIPVAAATYGLSRQLQLDYDMSDALLDLAFGGVLGGGMHVAGAKIGQHLIKRGIKSRMGDVSPAYAAELERMAPGDLSKLPDAATEFRNVVGNQSMREAMLGIARGRGFEGFNPRRARDIVADTRRFIQPVQTIGASREALQGAHHSAVAQTMQGKPVSVDTVFEVDRSLQDAEDRVRGTDRDRRRDRIARGHQAMERVEQKDDPLLVPVQERLAKWRKIKEERGRGRPAKDDPHAADIAELANDGITTDMTEAQVRAQAERVARSERRRAVLSRAQKAEAIAPHEQAIKTMAEGRSDWAEYGDEANRIFEGEETKPLEAYNEETAEQLDAEAAELLDLERALIEGREEGEELETSPELEAAMQPKPAAPPKPEAPAKPPAPPSPAKPPGPGAVPEAEPIKAYSPKRSEAIPAGQVGPDRAAGEFIFDASELEVDAKTFQFKAGGDKFGVTDKLQKVNRWDRTKAGKIVAYERLDGKVYVANGHQRVALAKRIKSNEPAADTSIVGTLYREKDGVSPDEITAIAAAVNIAEGSGSVIDMAKIARLHPDLMGEAMRVSDEKQRMAFDLTHLGDSSFGMVVNEVVPYQYAATVGRLLPEDEVRQSAAMNLLAKADPASQAEAESLVRQVASEDVQTEHVEDLFGGEDVATSLVLEKAQVAAELGKLLRTDKRTFNMLTERKGRIEAAGNKLDAAQNEAIAARAGELLQTFNTLAYRKGPISDALTKAAQEVKAGASKKTAARGLAEALARTDEIGGQDRGGAGPQERPGTDQPKGDKGVRKGGLKASFESAADPELEALQQRWREKGLRVFVADRGGRGEIQLSDLVVPKDARGQGLGSGFMQGLIDYADARGLRVTLTAAKDYGTTSLPRLKAFYKRFGFVENKGRNKDFAISDSMYREPSDRLPKGVEPPPTLKPSFVAYHGTPHDFDRFDIERIGTGEGAQVYGHGLYFAENRAVAEDYRRRLSGHGGPIPGAASSKGNYLVNGYEMPTGISGHMALDTAGDMHALVYHIDRLQKNPGTSGSPGVGTVGMIETIRGTLERRIDRFYEMHRDPRHQMGSAYEDMQAWAEFYDEHFRRQNDYTITLTEKPPGRIFEVELKGEAEDYLDWDAPLSEQSPKVIAALKSVGVTEPPMPPPIRNPELRALVKEALRQSEGEPRDVALMIDNDGPLYKRALAYAAKKGISEDELVDRNGVGAFIDAEAFDYLRALHARRQATGGQAYVELQGLLSRTGAAGRQAAPAATEALKKAGIKGIRYFDQGSRNAKEGTRNFVMFDDADIEIKMKAAMAQEARASEAAVNPVQGLHAGYNPILTAGLIEGSVHLKAFVKRLPPGVTFKFTTGQPLGRPAGAVLQGGYVAENRTLWLTSKAMKPMRTLRHEEIHVLRDMGLFREDEWQLLAERAGKLGDWVDAKTVAHYEAWTQKYDPDNYEAQLQEEAIAHMVAAYEHGARFGSKIDAILDRIIQFFEALRNAAKGLGFQTADDVIRAIEAGEIGRRAQAPLEEPSLGMAADMADSLKLWFGDSKVIDPRGEPLRVFHGSPKAGVIEEFDTYGSRHGLYGQGSYFTEDPAVASEYATKGTAQKPGHGVVPVYLKIENPIDMDAPADLQSWAEAFDTYATIEGMEADGVKTNAQAYKYVEGVLEDEGLLAGEGAEVMQGGLRDMGYDGITHIGGGKRDKTDARRHRVWIAFDPEQIKSAIGNTGAFDPTDPRITASLTDEGSDLFAGADFTVSDVFAATERQQAAEVMAMLDRGATPDELQAHPLVQAMIARSNAQPQTIARPDFGTPEYKAAREFNLGGERVTGWDNGVAGLKALAEDYAQGEIRNERRATIILGPPAAGKSVIAETIAPERGAAIVDPDDAKKSLPEFEKGIGASATHEESSILSGYVLDQIMEDGANVILPKVGGGPDSIRKLTAKLKERGYTVEITLMKVEESEAFRRSIRRFISTGRLVEPAYMKEIDGNPDRTFATLQQEGIADAYAEIDNNIPKGEPWPIAGTALQDVGRLGEDGGRRLATRDRGKPGAAETIKPSILSDPSQEIGFGPMFEATPAGEQAVIPGAEKEPQKKTLERKTEGAKKAKAPQKEGAGPLFDDYQADLLDFARQKRADEIVQKAQDLEPGLLGMAGCMARRG